MTVCISVALMIVSNWFKLFQNINLKLIKKQLEDLCSYSYSCFPDSLNGDVTIVPKACSFICLYLANEFWLDLIKVNWLVNMMLSQGHFFDCAQMTKKKEHSFTNEFARRLFPKRNFLSVSSHHLVLIRIH